MINKLQGMFLTDKIKIDMLPVYEEKFLIMSGALHIEKTLQNALGALLRGTGYVKK